MRAGTEQHGRCACSSGWGAFCSTAAQTHTELFAQMSRPRNSRCLSPGDLHLSLASPPIELFGLTHDQRRAAEGKDPTCFFPPHGNFYLPLHLSTSHWISAPTPGTQVPPCPSSEVPEVGLPVEMLWGYPLPRTRHKPTLQRPVSTRDPKETQNIWPRERVSLPRSLGTAGFFSL